MTDSFPDAGAIRFRKVRDAGSVLNATLAFVRRNARELTLSCLALIAPVALASGLALTLYMRQFAEVFADPEAFIEGDVQMFGVSYLGVVVFGLLGTALTQAAAGGYVRLYRQGEAGSITVGRLWEESRGLLLPFLGLPLVYGVVVALSAVVAVLPCLGLLAWFAFLVWSFPYYAVTVASRTLEAPSLAAAWGRARVLVKGSWGFAAGSLFLTMLVVVVVAFVLLILFSFAAGLVLANSLAEDPASIVRWTSAIYAPVQVVSYALNVVVVVAAFFVHGRLAEELDGTSLRDDLDVLAEAGFADRGFGDGGGRDRAAAHEPAPSDPAPDAPASGPGLPDGPAPLDEDPPSGETPGPSGFRGGGFGGP